jgi:acyl-CoA thioesterase I
MRSNVRNGLAGLLAVGLMIGCGGTERNTTPEEPADAAGSVDDNTARPGVQGVGTSSDDIAGRAGVAEADSIGERPVLLFLGTSLTAGQGVSPEAAYPALIEREIEAAGLTYRVVNAGVSGETSAGAAGRIDWLLQQPFEVLVLETGANDMLRGVDPATTEANIQRIVDRVRARRPEAPIVLAGMLALPNLGPDYGRAFEAIYPRLAERNDLVLIPFLLEGVAGDRAMNQSDGVHPTAEGHRRVARTVWPVLEPVLRERPL